MMGGDALMLLQGERQRALVGAPVRPERLPAQVRASVDEAVRLGAPALPALDAAAQTLRAERDLDHAIAAAVAPARVVATALVALPLALVPLLGRLTGTDPWAFYAGPAGRLVGLLGLVLWAVGALVAYRQVARARAGGSRTRLAPLALGLLGALVAGAPGFALGALLGRVLSRPCPVEDLAVVATAADIAAAGLHAGLAAPAALRGAAEHLPGSATALRQAALRLELGMPIPAGSPFARLASALAPDGDGGSIRPDGLRDLASDLRAERLARARGEVAQLATRLTFPTALCLLPATLLLVGAPVVAAGFVALAGR